MIILPCPKRPDLDCIAGSVAYAEYMRVAKQQDARVWICGVPDGEAQFYLDKFSELIFATDDEAHNANGFVLVDFSVKHALPESIDPLNVMQVIDHRDFTQPAIDFPNAVVQIDKVGAAATQVAEYFIRDSITPSKPIAAMLYGAIYTHTLCLKSATTTQRDRDAINWLTQHVPDADVLVDAQLKARSDEIIAQMPHILKTEMKTETSRFGAYGFTLLELQHGLKFWQDRQQEIIAWGKAQDYPVMINIIDLLLNESILYSTDNNYITLLETVLHTKAQDQVIHVRPAWFRKQIIPLLR